jgi:glycosyltransferase involved in cell wall biosynthesis
MLEASGDIRAFLDADLATPPEELLNLIAAIDQGADVAIGSRIQANGVDLRLAGHKPQPLARRVMGKLFRLVATRPFLGNIRDSQCGAKAFTAAAADRLFPAQHIRRWSFDIELLYLAKKWHLKVVEVPVRWEAQDNSKLKPSVSLALDTMRELATIAWIHRR